MHLSPTGSAACGYATVSIDGANVALLAGIAAGTSQGPAWLNSTHIVYQNNGAGDVGPSFQQSYNTAVPGFTTLNSNGSNRIFAGNNVWAAWLDGSGVYSSNGVNSFGILVDCSSDFGEIACFNSYPTMQGLSVYSASASLIYSDATILPSSPIGRLRGHVLAIQVGGGWQLIPVTGVPLTYSVRTDETINWITPIAVGSAIYLLEYTNNSGLVTIRPANSAQGYIIGPAGTLAANPDAVVLGGTIRSGWCTTTGEAAESLVVADFVIATQTLTTYTVSAGVLVPGTPQVLTPTTFQVGPPITTGGQNAFAAIPRSDQAISNRNGTYTRPMLAWMTKVSGSSQQAFAMAQSASSNPGAPGFSTIAGSYGVPVQAQTASDTVTFVGTGGITVTTGPSSKTVTISTPSGSTADYVVMSDGNQPPSPMDDGNGNFLYIEYTP